MTQSLIFIVPIIAFCLAQIIKSCVFWYHDKNFHVSNLFTDGGMPSGHSATMSSLTMIIYLVDGFTTTFLVSFFVSLVVFRDAYGVRLETSKQAVIINKVVKDLKISHEKRLKELIGHTKTQTFFGIVLGVVVALLAYFITII